SHLLCRLFAHRAITSKRDYRINPSTSAPKVAGYSRSDGLASVLLVISKAWTGINLEAEDLSFRSDFEIDSGKRQLKVFRQADAFFGKIVVKIHRRHLHLAALSLRIPVVRYVADDFRRKEFLADHVYSCVGTLDKNLKLRRAPADLLQAIEIAHRQFLHDGPNSADGFIDHAPVSRVKLPHEFRVVGD